MSEHRQEHTHGTGAAKPTPRIVLVLGGGGLKGAGQLGVVRALDRLGIEVKGLGIVVPGEGDDLGLAQAGDGAREALALHEVLEIAVGHGPSSYLSCRKLSRHRYPRPSPRQ